MSVADRHDLATRRWRLQRRLLNNDRFGLLVIAQAEIARVTQRAFIGHFSEGDFRDQPGAEPVGVPNLGAGRLDGGIVLFERFHDLQEPLQLHRIEARANLACIAEGAVVIDGEDQGAEGARFV
ncbi:hypothetical protein D3C80_1500870 [compost metagenome]